MSCIRKPGGRRTRVAGADRVAQHADRVGAHASRTGGVGELLAADGGWEDSGAGDWAFGLADHAAEAGFGQFYG